MTPGFIQWCSLKEKTWLFSKKITKCFSLFSFKSIQKSREIAEFYSQELANTQSKILNINTKRVISFCLPRLKHSLADEIIKKPGREIF